MVPLRMQSIITLCALLVVFMVYGWWAGRQNERLSAQLEETRRALFFERDQRAAADAALSKSVEINRSITSRNALLRGRLHDVLANSPTAQQWGDQPMDDGIVDGVLLDALPPPAGAPVQPDRAATDAAAHRTDQ